MNLDLTTGSIARAARVLEALSARMGGASLMEVVAATGFTKTTTHRVLATLQDVHFVFQDPERKSYHLGAALADISRRAELEDLASIARRPMRRLAELSGDTVFFVVAEGAAAVCVARELGAYPVRSLTLDRGDRTPLGVGGGALAIYCTLPDARRRACNRLNARWLGEYGLSEAQLEAGRDFYLQHGYAYNRQMVYPETSSIALPVTAPGGRVVGGLAIGAVYTRLSEERINDLLLPALRVEAAALSSRLRDVPEGRA